MMMMQGEVVSVSMLATSALQRAPSSCCYQHVSRSELRVWASGVGPQALLWRRATQAATLHMSAGQ